MGYYTYYELEVKKDGMELNDVLASAIYKKAEELDLAFVDVFDENLQSWDTRKWYDHDEDMLRLSEEFPDLLFTLFGDGEESTDFWYADYQNGKTKFRPGEVVYPDFDDVPWQ